MCITAMAVATARAALSHTGSGRAKRTLTPMTAESTCPPRRFLGWASGLLGAAKSSTAEAAKVLDRAIARSPLNPLNAELMARIRFAESKLPEARAYGEYYLALLPPGDRGRAAYEKWVKTLPAK